MKRKLIAWGQGRPARILLSYTTLLALGLMLSCEKKKEPEPDCGCESKQIGFLTETNAEYDGDGLFAVYDTSQYQMLGFYTICDYDPTWKISKRGTYDYRISGYYMKQCLEPYTIPLITNNPLIVSSIVLPK